MDEEDDSCRPLYDADAVALTKLSKLEWEQIEQVPKGVRAVAAAMQAEAEHVVQAVVDPEAARAAAERKLSYSFCEETWQWLNGKQEEPRGSGGAGKKKSVGRKEAIVQALENKTRQDLKSRVEAAGKRGAGAPRVEAFGKRTEAFAAAMDAWISHHDNSLDVVVSAHRAAAFLSSLKIKGADDAAATLRRSAEIAASRSGGVEALLERAVHSPEPLVRPSFFGPQAVALYPEQIEAAELLAGALLHERPLCLRYVTPPSGGKSSATALFGATTAQVLDWKRKTERKARRSPPYVIYACFSNAVRMEVSRTVLAANVPFGIVSGGVVSPSHRCYRNKEARQRAKRGQSPIPTTLDDCVEWSEKFMARCDSHPVVLVCDLQSAWAMRRRHREDEGDDDDVLLLDELTVGSEEGSVGDAAEFRLGKLFYPQLLKQPAKYTMLISAAVPEFSQMPYLVKLFSERHGSGAQFVTASSKRLSIGIEAKDTSGQIWLPHHLGPESTGALVGTECPDGHLLRFYSPAGLRLLLSELGIDCSSALRTDDFVSHDALRAAALRVLEQHQNRLQKKDPGLDVDDSHDCGSACGLATDRAWSLPGCTLVIGAGSEPFYSEAMSGMLREGPGLTRLLSKKVPKEKKERSRKPDSDEDERDVPEEVLAPRVQWPIESVVNSTEHFERQRATGRAPTGATLSRQDRKTQPYVKDEVVETSSVRLVESALSGVVLLDSPWSDRAFEFCGLALADTGQPSFVVSDMRMVYGVNLPVNRVLVLLPSGSLGVSELRQLCGRAGRTGKGAKAEVVFRSPRLLRAALGPLTTEDQARRAPLDVLLETGSTADER